MRLPRLASLMAAGLMVAGLLVAGLMASAVPVAAAEAAPACHVAPIAEWPAPIEHNLHKSRIGSNTRGRRKSLTEAANVHDEPVFLRGIVGESHRQHYADALKHRPAVKVRQQL